VEYFAEHSPRVQPFLQKESSNAIGKRRNKHMFLVIALVLVLAWVGGFVVFHTAGFFIHLLLIFAVISVIMHFVRGRA
jgi:hypothetical protein